MAMAISTEKFLFLLGLLVAVSHTVLASDPDLTTDFNVTNANASSFTTTQFRNVPPKGPGQAGPTFAMIPGLNGLGLTAVLFEFGPQSQIDPHTHPRATEVFYVLTGCVDVGFVDTSNDLFEITLQTGDIFVFPKGLLHWQRNNLDTTASGYSVLSSENPGVLSIAKALFISHTNGQASGLPDIVLSTAFGTSTQEIDTVRGTVAARNPPQASS